MRGPSTTGQKSLDVVDSQRSRHRLRATNQDEDGLGGQLWVAQTDGLGCHLGSGSLPGPFFFFCLWSWCYASRMVWFCFVLLCYSLKKSS
jgi:hypothetical protein